MCFEKNYKSEPTTAYLTQKIHVQKWYKTVTRFSTMDNQSWVTAVYPSPPACVFMKSSLAVSSKCMAPSAQEEEEDK